jgi:hypothetical protein
MGITQEHALGRSQRFAIEAQSAMDTMVRATAAGGFNALKVSIDYAQARMDRNDNRDTAGLVSRTSGKRTISYEVEGYLIPSGTAGTAPDMQEFFQSGLGSETVNAGTSVVYGLSNTQAMQVNTLTRAAYPGGAGTFPVYMETLIGAWVNTTKFSFSGADEPRVAFSGGASRMVHTGRSQLNGAMVTSATMVLDNDRTALLVEQDSIIQVGANTNTGTGYRVTVDTARPSFTLETTQSAADDAAVVPYMPTPTLAGNPIAGILGAFTFDGGALQVVSGEVTIDNGVKPLDDFAFAVHVPDIIRGRRSVTGSFTMRVRADQLAALGIRKNSNFTAIDCQLVLGSVAGSICTIDMDRCELEFSAVDFPEDEEATVQVPFTCLEQNTTSANAITITFT